MNNKTKSFTITSLVLFVLWVLVLNAFITSPNFEEVRTNMPYIYVAILLFPIFTLAILVGFYYKDEMELKDEQ